MTPGAASSGAQAGGRRRGWPAALVLLALDCTTTAPTPYPCLRIDEVPGLRAEMMALRDDDLVRQQLKLEPRSLLVRAYAKAASIACAYDRELEAPTPDLERTAGK